MLYYEVYCIDRDRHSNVEWNMLNPRTRTQHLCRVAPDTCLPSSAGEVLCYTDEATFDQWAGVRTASERGGNSPPLSFSFFTLSLSLLPGNQCCLKEGQPATCPVTEWTQNKKTHRQQMSYTSQVLFVFFFSPFVFFYSFMAHSFTSWQYWKKREKS